MISMKYWNELKNVIIIYNIGDYLNNLINIKFILLNNNMRLNT